MSIAKELKLLREAYKDGKTIQRLYNGEWVDIMHFEPSAYRQCVYRTKPD